MDLILVRCADLESEAGPIPPDAPDGDSPILHDPLHCGLSERGQRHARRLGQWLRGHAPRQLQMFSSPAKGAREMTELLAGSLAAPVRPPVVSRLLGPGARASDLLGAVGWPHDHSAALLVAHQPALGALASLLLTGQEGPLAFKKGAIWWFSNRHRGGEQQTVLRCALSPDLLKSGGRSAREVEAAEGVVEPGEPGNAPTAFRIPLPDVVDLVRMRLAGG